MKKTYFILFILFSLCQKVFSQQIKPDSNILTVTLNEVTVKDKKQNKFANKARPQDVTLVLNPTKSGKESGIDSTYYVTKLNMPNNDSIFMSALEFRLKPFDSNMFDINLIIFQPQNKDTLFKLVRIDPSRIGKKNRIKVDLFKEHIILLPQEVYIGFGFHPKKIPAPYNYRLYSTDKGEGAILKLKNGGFSMISNPYFPYVFQFKMFYEKY